MTASQCKKKKRPLEMYPMAKLKLLETIASLAVKIFHPKREIGEKAFPMDSLLDLCSREDENLLSSSWMLGRYLGLL